MYGFNIIAIVRQFTRSIGYISAALSILVFAALTPQPTEISPLARAISECDKIAVDNGSLLTDNEKCIDPCVAPAEQVVTTNDPGSLFVLGDSIGQGVTPELQGVLRSDQGWSINGDSRVGRPLSEGISIAESKRSELSSSKYILVVLGTNNLGNASNQADVTRLMEILKPTGAKIFWLKVNVTRQDLTGLVAPYNQILASSGATLIDNTAEISGDGVHPANYSELANIVASSIKGGSATDSSAAQADAIDTNPQPQDTSNLSIREKLANLIFVRANTKDEIDAAAGQKVGGIFVRPSDKNDIDTYNAIKGAVAGQKTLVGVDYEGGRVQAPGTDITGAVPSARELGTKSADEIKNIAKEKGSRLSSLGINLDFAPVVDIGGTNNAVIGDRAFGNDPNTVKDKAGAFIDGLGESGVVATLKHFPGHGSSEGDSHQAPVRTKSLAELEARDILPFKDLSTKAKTIVMMGHLLVPDWGSQATSLNPKAYEYLRQVVNYNGVVITDALDMQGIPSPSDQPSRALVSIQAGADMALITSTSQMGPTLDKLEQAVSSGQLSQERVDQSVQRVSTLRAAIGATPTTTPEISCAPCNVSGSVPIDGENPKRAFQYFLSVQYKAEWAAGIVGNMVAESSVEPQRLQGTAQGTITPAADAAGSSLGWGIVQWTPAGKFINAVGVDKANDFAVQLDFVYQQLEGTGALSEKGAGDALKATSTVEEATGAFMTKYERPKDQSAAAIAKRAVLAQSVFDKYNGSAAAALPAGTGGGSSCTQTSDATKVGDLAWPVDVKFWQDHPEWFTKPHHDYPAADIPVPTGTKAYSLISGRVKYTTSGYGGGCGTGLVIESGANQVAYCHGIPGSLKVSSGQDVQAGDILMDTDNTGSSTGPHLHVGIKVNGEKRCPQAVFEKMGKNEPSVDFASLPSGGCSY